MTDREAFRRHMRRRSAIDPGTATDAELRGLAAAEATEAALAEAGYLGVAVGVNRRFDPTVSRFNFVPDDVKVRALLLGHHAMGHRTDRLSVDADGRVGIDCEAFR